jgi:serine/threonine-protein kinase
MDPASLPTSLGEFRIQSVLGEGGSGIVYDATWGPRRVALKVLHPSLADTERIRAQFLSEAQKLQTITHPSVVKVLAVGELPDRRPYLAMERLEGETLASVLSRGALSVAQALELFGELCHAVGTLHEQGLIHRDLKPENVFIVNGKHAVLLDFGIAKEVSAPASTTTMDGGVRGTPAYMAPERFFGQPAGIATDLYELAVTLYAMLAGRLPWDDLGDPEARLSPRPLVDLVAVPEELDVEIRRALSTRAQNRPASAAALLDGVLGAGRGSAPTLAAGETARMRPATDAPNPAKTTDPHATRTADKKPWFAERQNTTDRGKTPLAWVPSERAPQPARPVSRRRWPWIAGAIAIVGVAGGALAWRMADRDDAPRGGALPADREPVAVLAADKDPWGSPQPAATSSDETAPVGSSAPVSSLLSSTTTPEIAIAGPELSMTAARTEVGKAITHLPADTTMIIAGLVGPLRRDDRFTGMFDKIAANPTLGGAVATLPPCVRGLVAKAEWFVFGSVGFLANEQGTLMLRGRWKRADVEACFAGPSEPFEMTDGARMLQLPAVGWIDFLDEHTVYISVRQDLAAAQVHENVKRGVGLTRHARTLLATLPAERALTFVLDGSGDVAWPNETLPKGSDAVAWMRPEDKFVVFEMAMDVKTAAEATKLEASIAAQLEGVFEATNPSIGTIQAKRTGTKVRVTGSLSALMMGIVASAIP